MLQRLITGQPGNPASPLDSPWGLAIAPSNFGDFSGDLLVGNFGNGKTNAFDPATGAFLGTLASAGGSPIVIDGLWALQFGNGNSAGDTNTLLFTAGGGGEQHGLLGAIVSAASTPLSGDGGKITATEGATFNGSVAAFASSDGAATAGSFTANIDWGDGTTSAGTIASNGDGGFNISGTRGRNPASVRSRAWDSATIGAMLGYYRAEFWGAVMLIQLIATMLLAAALRALGWQIVQFDTAERAKAGAWLQFSIRHILIATTAAALFTAFGKAVVTHSAGGMNWKQWLQGAIDGSTLGILSLAAVWAALGTGRAMVRLPALLLLAIFLTGQLWWVERTATAIVLKTGAQTYLFRQTVAGPWWMAWTLLAGAFLASWLSVLRATGYRLVWQRTG